MSSDEMRAALEEVRAQLAQLSLERQADEVRIGRLEETVKTLAQVSANLVTLAQSHDERLDNFVRTVERYIRARGPNGHENP